MSRLFPVTPDEETPDGLFPVPTHERQEAKPPIKWVGGKGRLLSQLVPLLPASFGQYHEPFIGGGALFFSQQPKRATLSDVNRELIDTYTAIRDNLAGVVEVLSRYKYEKNFYYGIRALDPWTLSLEQRAARMLYLNRTCFNGLYRVNSKGKFNTPFGKYDNPTICDEENLAACSLALQGVTLLVREYREVLDTAQVGDFVYFDPPYVPVSGTSDFTAYDSSGFGWDKQQELAEVYTLLSARGVFALLSNSDVPALRDLYKGFRVHSVTAGRSINSKGAKRGPVGEVVIRNW